MPSQPLRQRLVQASVFLFWCFSKAIQVIPAQTQGWEGLGWVFSRLLLVISPLAPHLCSQPACRSSTLQNKGLCVCWCWGTVAPTFSALTPELGHATIPHGVILKRHCSNLGRFPGGTGGKEPTCQCRRYKRCGFDPWVGKIPWVGRRAW